MQIKVGSAYVGQQSGPGRGQAPVMRPGSQSDPSASNVNTPVWSSAAPGIVGAR